MYYTVYKITNIVNGKIYIGKHQTENLDDGYFGSGKVLKRAIKKHGIENFIKEYIKIFDNEEDMNILEAKLVNPTFVANSSTYNLKLGGEGGFDFINENKLNTGNFNISLVSKEGNNKIKWLNENDIEWSNKIKLNNTNSAKGNANFKGKQHSDASKKRMGVTKKIIGSQKGANNSQFGTIWINDGIKNKKIKKEDFDIWYNIGFHRGKVINIKS